MILSFFLLFNRLYFLKKSSKTHFFVSDLEDGFFFGVVTTPNSPRQQLTRENWADEVQKNYKNNEIAFLTQPGKEFPEYKYVHISNKLMEFVNKTTHDRWLKDIFVKKYTGAKYFLKNTRKKWYWAVCDDVAVDAEKISVVLQYLNSRYDTENENVELGHCIDNNYVRFLQGGSGFILSRRAAHVFVKYGLDFIRYSYKADDVALEKLQRALNLKDNEIGTQYMIGHIDESIKEKLDNLKKCPDQVPYTICYGQKLFHINDIVLIHYSKTNYTKMVMDTIKEARKRDQNIYYYFDKGNPHFCKK